MDTHLSSEFTLSKGEWKTLRAGINNQFKHTEFADITICHDFYEVEGHNRGE